jgi:hypothetical protein
VLSLLLAASWLALSRSLEPVHLLSAALIGLIVPRLLHRFCRGQAASDWGGLAPDPGGALGHRGVQHHRGRWCWAP